MAPRHDENRTLPPKTFALSELTRSIQSVVERSYTGRYRIVAELSKLNHYSSSGHCYPVFVEKNDDRIVAEMTGFIPQTVFRRVSAQFMEKVGRPISDGMEILFTCRVQFHFTRGLSLLVTDVDASHTMGAMFRLREKAVQKLREEGVFDLNKSLRLPKLLRRVAAISVETSKGWQDFKSILSRSEYNRAIRTTLFPSLLQGDAAVARLMSALDAIEVRKDEFDAVTIIRGGGGETGLDCFDNYALAKKVATFPLPVLTGIGHATNLTVSEQVAHNHFITPSELAHFILGGFRDFDDRTEKAARALQFMWKNSLTNARDRLDMMSHALMRHADKATHLHEVRTFAYAHRLKTASDLLTSDARVRLHREIPAVLERTVERWNQEALRLETLTQKLERETARRLKRAAEKGGHLEEKIHMLDPRRMLERGFSMVMRDGKSVSRAEELSPGEEVHIIFASGSAEAEIKKLKSK